MKEIVVWPESQELMERKGFTEHCKLINDEEGLARFGSAAYLVDKEWLHSTPEYVGEDEEIPTDQLEEDYGEWREYLDEDEE